MIYNFILPEVEKHNMRRQIHNEQSCIQNEKILELPSSEPLLVVDQESVKNEDVQATVCMADTVKIDHLLI